MSDNDPTLVIDETALEDLYQQVTREIPQSGEKGYDNAYSSGYIDGARHLYRLINGNATVHTRE